MYIEKKKSRMQKMAWKKKLIGRLSNFTRAFGRMVVELMESPSYLLKNIYGRDGILDRTGSPSLEEDLGPTWIEAMESAPNILYSYSH